MVYLLDYFSGYWPLILHIFGWGLIPLAAGVLGLLYSPFKKTALALIVAVVIAGPAYIFGVKDGKGIVQAEWDADKARIEHEVDNAVSGVTRNPSERVRSDPWNSRDN